MRKTRFFAPLAVLILATGAIWLWQWLQFQDFASAERKADRRYGEVILAGAEGAIHRQCRRRFTDLASLTGTLEDIRTRVGATYLAIVEPVDRPFVSVGKSGPDYRVTRLARPFRFPGPYGGQGRMMGRPEGGGGPGCEDCPFPEGDVEIRLEYPADRLQDRLAHGRLRFFAVSGAFSLALLSLFLFYVSRLRSADLRAELAAADEKVKSLEFLRRLGAGLAHETKNPLGAVRGFAELLQKKELREEEVRDAAGRIVEETDRIVTRLDEFMLLSRPARPDLAEFDLKSLLEDLAALIRLELAGKNATLAVRGDAVQVRADQEQVRRLFMNLLVNAADALDEHGSITVTIQSIDRGARVTVADDGCGVPEALRATLFEPYVTGKANGTGLGLAIARRIATEHGWSMCYEPGVPRGTAVVVETQS